MKKKLGVAGLQLIKNNYLEEPNITKFEEKCRWTKSVFPWVDLIFTGELFLFPYMRSDWKDHAKSIPQDLTNRLSNLAKELDCWLVPGSIYEKDDSEIYNTCVVFNPSGEIVAKYRKIFPWLPFEDSSSGTEFITFDIPGIAKIGLMICYDIWFPEVGRTLTWNGADVILQLSATYTPDRKAELVLTQAQAIMNQCYILNSNVISNHGGGQSLFVDPEGRILQIVGTHEEVMTEVIDIEKVSWVRQYGSYATAAVWKSLRDSPLKGKFPPYENFSKGPIFEQLGKMKYTKSIREWEEP